MNDEIVTKFLLNTCRLRPQLTRPAVQAALQCATLATIDVEHTELIPMLSGSVAEFYIEPMLPHVGDVDVMYHWSGQLAIPRGHPPPTQLPDEFHNYVQVFEFIDSHLPGYVYLELRYLVTECVDDDKYNAVEYDRYWYASNKPNLWINRMRGIHGPALLVKTDEKEKSILSLDIVNCMRCLTWPPQAADWPTRNRNYGWPDSATVDRVVSNGCDVVGVAHRQCRQHEWMGAHQWRLSFSRAEIVLINSWTPVQQIVYHMFRVFMKTERLTDSADNSEAGTLSNYHIKTLMLWACELKPRIWWTDECCVVRICIELFRDLAVWLTEARCLHYFINNCNLIDSSVNLEMIQSRLVSINGSWLSSWFVNNYIRRCSQLCPHNVSRLFDYVSTATKLQNAVSAIVDWRHNTILRTMFDMHLFAAHNITLIVSDHSLTQLIRSLFYYLTELRKICLLFVCRLTACCLQNIKKWFK